MDLTFLQFESRQVPHREVSEFPPGRIHQEALGHGAKKAPIPIPAPDPTGMIHVGRESPSRSPPCSTLIARNHVAIGVVLDPHMPTCPQLRDDRIAHRIFVKGSGWLFDQRANYP